MRYGFLVASLALLLAGYAFGRAQGTDSHSISLGSVTVYVGMSRDSTIAALSTHYAVSDLGTVTMKSGPPYESLGQVVFKDGKLSQVWKDWALSNQEQGYELANSLYGILDGFKREGRTACTLVTSADQDPKFETKTILLHCGEKQIRLDAEQVRQGEQMRRVAVLNEILTATN